MIEIQNINKSFGDNHVLKGIDATFEPGKISLIIGGSGSGKSTLLKCMVGLHQPEEGKVLYGNEDFSRLSNEGRIPIRKEIGMLFQNSALFDSMTVEQNIMFPLDMFSDMSKAEKFWEGSNQDMLRSDVKELNNFVFASPLMKAAKESL